jgi:hypothetical protein
MDQEECSTLMAVFQGIPDPRQARGRRYPWPFLLTLASGQQTAHGIAQWVSLHAAELRERLRPPRASMPSESTLRRTLRGLDLPTLELRVACHAQYLAAEGAQEGTITTESGQILQARLWMARRYAAYGPMVHPCIC